MKEYPYNEDNLDIEELLSKYEQFRKGQSVYIEEESFERIVNYFESQEQFKKAMQAVRAGIEQYPYSAGMLIKQADLLLNDRRYEEALEILEHAAIFDSGDINLYILKTEALLALDRQEEAVALLETGLQLFDGEERIDLLFELSDVYDDFEDFDKVFDCLKAILEQEPNNEEALYKICFWTDCTGRNAESIDLHRKIIDEYPYNELAWFNLAAAYQGIKLYEKAIDAYQYALVIDEKFDYAYRNMGDAYIRLRKYKEAIEALSRVLELTKPESVIYEAIGHCYERLKNYAQARFYYRKASHLNQDDSLIFYKIATTYFYEEKYEQCARQLETALRIKRNKPEYNLLMGECKMQLGLGKEALQYFMNAVRLRPKSVQAWEALVRGLYISGLYDECVQQADFVLSLMPEKYVFLYYKAAANFGLGKTKQALLELEDALTKSPAMVKKLFTLNPSILQYQQVNALLVKYKRKRKGK
ncbi:MAG: tetratricopeptide repeat protein [Niabella sp.]